VGLWKEILESKYATWRELDNREDSREKSWWWRDIKRQLVKVKGRIAFKKMLYGR